jgi:hypothetical protein
MSYLFFFRCKFTHFRIEEYENFSTFIAESHVLPIGTDSYGKNKIRTFCFPQDSPFSIQHKQPVRVSTSNNSIVSFRCYCKAQIVSTDLGFPLQDTISCKPVDVLVASCNNMTFLCNNYCPELFLKFDQSSLPSLTHLISLS